MKTLVYKRGLSILSYLTLIKILLDRSDLCYYTPEVPKTAEVTQLSQVALLSWSPLGKPCPEPFIPTGQI